MNNKFWHGRRVLITGHTGFKGSWLSFWLSQLGAKVYGYALEPDTNPSFFNLLNLASQITHVIGDVRDLEQLTQCMVTAQPEIIIHMAAQPLVRYSYEHPVETYSTNVMGVVNLYEAVKATDSVRVVVNVTTDKCYENKEWPWGYRESESLGGYDPYSNSKACSELVTAAYRSSYFNVNDYSKHGKAIASARAGNVIGGGDWSKDRLIPDIIRALQREEPIKIRYPNAIRPWQHVLEPLSGYLTLSEKMWEAPTSYAQAWNFGPEDIDAKPVKYLVEKIANYWPNKVVSEYDESSKKVHEAQYLKLDISKAKQYLQWAPRWSIDEAVQSVAEWYKGWLNGEDLVKLTLKQIEAFSNK